MGLVDICLSRHHTCYFSVVVSLDLCWLLKFPGLYGMDNLGECDGL